MRCRLPIVTAFRVPGPSKSGGIHRDPADTVRATVGRAAPLLERGRPTRDDVQSARPAEIAVL